MEYYLAVDIGASSGRHMLGCIESGKIKLEEVYRFPNSMLNKNGRLCWDLGGLFSEIINGLKKCKEIGKIPSYMGIDTWGVDFVLLDKDDCIIGDTIGYRDDRTEFMDERVSEIISISDLYERTGIQKQIFNSIYQLMSIRVNHPDQLETAHSFLMIPDYFHFLLTGKKTNEYTNATTTQLVSPVTKDWDYELIDMLGFPKDIFSDISMPGSIVGTFSECIEREVGFPCTVVLPPTHDTASSVLAVPFDEDGGVYICSGTWSLMGVELEAANCSKAGMDANFTNEGGYAYRFRYLKNIMGLWMIQSVKKELKDKYTFSELCEMAAGEKIISVVDCNDSRFLSPDSMIDTVKVVCAETGQPIPVTPGEIAAVIYRSLAKCYEITVSELEKTTGKAFDKIHIVGGGVGAGYLNRLTADATGRKVIAGPVESTAAGNIAAQMISTGELEDLADARNYIRKSFETKTYKPATD